MTKTHIHTEGGGLRGKEEVTLVGQAVILVVVTVSDRAPSPFLLAFQGEQQEKERSKGNS